MKFKVTLSTLALL